jgi:hypothetical protein
MIEIDGNKVNTLTFNLNLSGTTKPPKARLMIPVNESVSIAFPAEIKENKAVVEVLPLRKYVDKVYEKLENVVLEVIIGETLFYPWTGDFKVTNIMIVEAADPVIENTVEKRMNGSESVEHKSTSKKVVTDDYI